MKTLCELKRKDISKYFELLIEQPSESGYVCRECLRFAAEKKRLCEPVAVRKVLHPDPPLDNLAAPSGK
jgi:hypothetical protein